MNRDSNFSHQPSDPEVGETDLESQQRIYDSLPQRFRDIYDSLPVQINLEEMILVLHHLGPVAAEPLIVKTLQEAFPEWSPRMIGLRAKPSYKRKRI